MKRAKSARDPHPTCESERDSPAPSGSGEWAIHARRLCKSYGDVVALRELDLDVRRGEVFGFLGPNGAGKTTAIRCFLDAIRPSSGELRVLGFDPQARPMEVHRRVGYLPGELALDDSLSARDALRLFASLRGGEVDWQHAERTAERLRLEMDGAIRNMSKGNKQKVAVVQAFMHRPELLLLDEPTSGLDPLMQREVLSLVREARADGATTFFSSHILAEVDAIADRVGVIRAGRLVEVSEPAKLRQRSLRRMRVTFARPVDERWCADLERVTLTSRNEDGTHWRLDATGDMAELLRAMADAGACDVETEHPSLEEVFLEYYSAPAANDGANDRTGEAAALDS